MSCSHFHSRDLRPLPLRPRFTLQTQLETSPVATQTPKLPYSPDTPHQILSPLLLWAHSQIPTSHDFVPSTLHICSCFTIFPNSLIAQILPVRNNSSRVFPSSSGVCREKPSSWFQRHYQGLPLTPPGDCTLPQRTTPPRHLRGARGSSWAAVTN